MSFLALYAVWLFTCCKGFRAAADRKFKEHQKWMIRSFGITLVAVYARALITSFDFELRPLQRVYASRRNQGDDRTSFCRQCMGREMGQSQIRPGVTELNGAGAGTVRPLSIFFEQII